MYSQQLHYIISPMRFLLAFRITLVIKNKIVLMYIYHILIYNLHSDAHTYIHTTINTHKYNIGT